MKPPKGWFQHRYKCRCGWDGPAAAITKRVTVGHNEFPVCPGCQGVAFGAQGRQVSILAGYAIHAACGAWHRPGTPCGKEKRP